MSELAKVLWHAEQHGAFWYCTRTRSRLPEALWCTSEAHAEEAARQLNMLDTYYHAYEVR